MSKLLYLKINFEVTPFIDTTIENTDNPYVNEENISEQDGENKVKALSNTIEESIVLIRDITDSETSKEAYENYYVMVFMFMAEQASLMRLITLMKILIMKSFQLNGTINKSLLSLNLL